MSERVAGKEALGNVTRLAPAGYSSAGPPRVEPLGDLSAMDTQSLRVLLDGIINRRRGLAMALQEMQRDMAFGHPPHPHIAAAEAAVQALREQRYAVERALGARNTKRQVKDDRKQKQWAAQERAQAISVAHELAARLEAAEKKIASQSAGDMAIEFMEMARLVLSESTFNKIRNRAADEIRRRKTDGKNRA